MEETRINAGPDLVQSFLSIVEDPKNLPANHLMAMFSLYTLVNILNLVQPASSSLPVNTITQQTEKPDKEILMDTLGGLLKSQGMNVGDLLGILGGKAGDGEQNPGDLLAMLGKNPAALMNFMNLLTSAKEAMNAGKREDKLPKKVDESKTIPFKERNS